MHGLPLEIRYRLIRAAERTALARLRAGEGRQLVLTPTDVAVLRALLFYFHNRASGRCDPGMRAIARQAGVGLGTVPDSVRRLQAAGLLHVTPRHVRVRARLVRVSNSYAFPSEAPRISGAPRSEFARNPQSQKKKARERAPSRPPSWAKVEEARAALARARARFAVMA
jgi:hypothetical protein